MKHALNKPSPRSRPMPPYSGQGQGEGCVMGRPLIVTRVQLDMLDQAEIVEGYRDGWDGLPCGDNRSDSYWHGWRNAMTDRGKMPKTDAQARLAHDVVSNNPGPRP